MKKIRWLIFFGFFLFLWCSCYAAKKKQVTTVAVGINPAGIVVTPNNRWVYVANNDSVVPAPVNGSSISVIDTASQRVIKTISDSSFNGTYALGINAEGSTLYVLNSGVSLTASTKTISIINTANNLVVGTISGFNGPDAIAFKADGKFAYVANGGHFNYLTKATQSVGNTVSLVNLKTRKIIKTIRVGLGPSSLAISGNYLYVSNFFDDTISRINMSTNAVVTIADPTHALNGPYVLTVHPNGRYAYVSNYGNPIKAGAAFSNAISVINLKTNIVEKNIHVGVSSAAPSYPAGIAVTHNGKYIIVTSYTSSGTIALIDTKNNKVLTHIRVGNSPGAVVVSPDDKRAYVTNYMDNSVSIIALDDLNPPIQTD